MTTSDEEDLKLDPLRREAWSWFVHVSSGDATRADLAALKRWRTQSPRHAEAFAQASLRWQALRPAMESIVRGESQLAAVQGRKRAVGRRAFIGGAMAASAAGAAFIIVRPPFGLWPSVSEFSADHRTTTGEQRRLTLTDRLSVEMNTQTSLNVRSSAAKSGMIELIAGEAIVAAQSQPVEVIASDVRARADTAQFNVRCDGSEVQVTCLAGAVQVERNGQSITLAPSHQIKYAARGLGQTVTVDPDEVTGWRQGNLFFRDEPLSRVIAEINRYRPGKIILLNDALGERHFTARFKLDHLDLIAQLKAAFGAQVTPLPGGIVLVS